LGGLLKDVVQFFEKETVVRTNEPACPAPAISAPVYNPARVEPGGIGDNGWLIDKAEDTLLVTGASSQVGEQLIVNFRFILRSTLSVVVADSLILNLSAGDRSVQSVTYSFKGNPLFDAVGDPDIYLTDVSIQATKATTRGQSFVRVNLVRQSSGANAGSAPTKCALLSDYVTQQVSACLRNARHFTSIEGRGWMNVLANAQDVVGADLAFVVPVNTRWRFVSCNGVFSSSNQAATRYIGASLFPSNLGAACWRAPGDSSVTATRQLNVSVGSIPSPITGNSPQFGYSNIPVPPDVFLLPGGYFSYGTLNLQTGDKWLGGGASVCLVEEWLDNV
jgi:hypothetical protein